MTTQDDTTSDYGAVLPLPAPAGAAGLGEAILSRLVVAQGLVTREQLRALLSRRATGDLRPLEELLLEAGLAQASDLERLRAVATGAGADPLTPSGGVPVRAAPAPASAAPSAPGEPASSGARGWGAAAAVSASVEAGDPAERTVEFGDVLTPAALEARAAALGLTPAPEPAPADAPAPAPATGPEPAFSVSQMEWGRAPLPRPDGPPRSDDDASDDDASALPLGSAPRSVRTEALLRAPRRSRPWGALGAVALLGLAALAGARLVVWSRAERRAEWKARVGLALQAVVEGDGAAALAALPVDAAPPGTPADVAAGRALAEGAAMILRGDAGPGLVALEQGAAALAGLEPEVGRAVERLRARALVSTGRVVDAASLLEALVARAPHDAAALTLLADAALELDRRDDAARRLEAAAAAVDDEPRRAALLDRAVALRLEAGDAAGALAAVERVGGRPGAQRFVARGDVCFVLGRIDAAREAYAAALGARPSTPAELDAAHLGLARVALVTGDVPAARAQLDAASGASPLERTRLRAAAACADDRPLDALGLLADVGADAGATLLVADAQLALGDARAALGALASLERAEPVALALRARAHLLLGEPDAAREQVELLRAAPAAIPARPVVHVLGGSALAPADLAALGAVLLGEVALAAGTAALDEARAALRGVEGSALARLTLARLERRAGDLAAARAALVEAAALAPRDPTPALELARVELARGALEGACAALDEAVARDPAAPTPRLERAELRLRLGDPVGAADDLRRCHGAVDPLRLLVVQARVAASAGDMAAAAERWQAALRLDPDDPRLVSEAARACAAAGQLDRADRLLERLADLDPGDPDVQLARARVLLEREEPAAALDAAARALALAPSPAAHVVRARALLRLGRPDDARVALTEAARPGETADTLITRALVEVHEATPATADERRVAARRLLDRTLALDLTVSLPALLCREGRRHADDGRPVAAELSFRLALERDRRFLEAHHGLVRLLVARGDWRAVSDAAGRLLAEHPDDAVGRDAMAEASRRLKR